MIDVIKFLKIREPYGFLSNFWPSKIIYDDREWATSEHLYQAMKHLGSSYEEDVRKASSAWVAMKMGRDTEHPPRENWESIKDDVMRHVLALKFSQSESLTVQLLATNDIVLVEHGYHDKYWADGGDGSGLNRLGEILMEVREVIRINKNESRQFEIKVDNEPIMYVSSLTSYLHELSKITGMKK